MVARSSVEAEYKSMAHGICEALWLRLLFHEIGLKVQTPMSLYYDNKSAIVSLTILCNMTGPST